MNQLHHVVFVQQGSSGTLRLFDQERYHVVREVWQRSALLDTAIHGKYDTREEAEERAKDVQKEYTFQ